MNSNLNIKKDKICCISHTNFKGGSETYINNIIKNSELNLDWFFFESHINKSFDLKSQKLLGKLPKNLIKRTIYFFKVINKINKLGYKNIITFGFYPSFIGLILKIIKPNIFWTVTQREEYSWANKFHKIIIYLFQFLSNRIETNAFHIKKKLSLKPFLQKKNILLSESDMGK